MDMIHDVVVGLIVNKITGFLESHQQQGNPKCNQTEQTSDSITINAVTIDNLVIVPKQNDNITINAKTINYVTINETS